MRRVAVLTLAFAVLRIATAALLSDPGYTDAYYFTDVARLFAHGLGLSADFLWSPADSPDLASVSIVSLPSHRFWVPLPTVIASVGIALGGDLVGTFRAAQLPFLILSFFIPPATYLASRRLGAGEGAALVAATIAGLGTVIAPFVVSVDAIGIAALLGTAFFVAFGRAANGSLRAGLVAGALVGLLYLARSEAALFGLALLALVFTPRARIPGAAGALVALVIGGAWFARDVSLGPTDQFARAASLLRYEDFFAFKPEYGLELGPRLGALATNLITFAFVFALLPLAPLAAGLRALWARPDVRAFAGLALLVYLAESLVFTLHSTRGSYLHSLAAFVPYGLAIAAVGGERLLASRTRDVAMTWTWATLAIAALLSAGAVLEVDGGLAETSRARAAAVDAISHGPFLAIDAAAWRWIADRQVAVTPADGQDAAICLAGRVGAKSVVLEAAHFSKYDGLYNGSERWAWLSEPVVRGSIKVFPIRAEIVCDTVQSR